jgi:hypothetical protein
VTTQTEAAPFLKVRKTLDTTDRVAFTFAGAGGERRAGGFFTRLLQDLEHGELARPARGSLAPDDVSQRVTYDAVRTAFLEAHRRRPGL